MHNTVDHAFDMHSCMHAGPHEMCHDSMIALFSYRYFVGLLEFVIALICVHMMLYTHKCVYGWLHNFLYGCGVVRLQ